ncbi:MAG: aminomethyl-transferring glycine dehydrogenase subunit GcvPB, partial [Bacillota bacterium]
MNGMEQTLISEMSRKGRTAYSLPLCDVPICCPADVFPEVLMRPEPPALPEVSEVDLVRHFTRLSQNNYGVDTGFYPLGSCTMKYNPKMNEAAARLSGFSNAHPAQPAETAQGALALLYDLNLKLCAITGMAQFTLQPAAGAHGEMTGLMIIKAYHESRGDHKRTKILVPDSAHGTNPASAAIAGFDVVNVRSNAQGMVDLDDLSSLIDDETAGLMLTNPNTLGLFDTNIKTIADKVHEAGGLLYYDGANFNAILGVVRPGDMGFDVVHLNLHKTFSTPHGGGGPGSGPVGVRKDLMPFLPRPTVEKTSAGYVLEGNRPQSIGRVRSFYGNFGVAVRAYAYILTMGAEGLKQVAENAVLNANYVQSRLKEKYDLPYDTICMHETVLSGKRQGSFGVSSLDIAKRLIDYGYHPPTMYFPLIVKEALMIEPTETESKETLDD